MTERQRKIGIALLFGFLGILVTSLLISLVGYTWFPDTSQRQANLVIVWGSLGGGVIAGAVAAWKL